MQQIGNTKSILYGAIMMIIFMISSCEFGVTGAESSVNGNASPLEIPTLIQPAINLS